MTKRSHQPFLSRLSAVRAGAGKQCGGGGGTAAAATTTDGTAR